MGKKKRYPKIFASSIGSVADVPAFIDDVCQKRPVTLVGSARQILHVVSMVKRYATMVSDSRRREQAIRVIACGHGGLIGELCAPCVVGMPETPGLARRSVLLGGDCET